MHMNKFNPNHGGREALTRVLDAYGFKTRTELSQHTGITNSTFGTWWSRDYYPAQVIIWCSLETGVSLRWLATGEGPMYDDAKGDITSLTRYKIIKGKLVEDGHLVLDNSLLSPELTEPKIIVSDEAISLVDSSFEEISDGTWLVEIEGKVSIRNLELIPVGKVRVSGTEIKIPFECALNEISVLARVDSVLKKV
ncbi:phage repressor protein CI [Yersinia enterocolitica]|nr:phage repressor protein CI [Yersinia enterocolitica]EKN4062432.1 phage repressor protein CI [Yersinia enterocolitica]CQH25074.1 CI repressor [Yersinia enterocolitica]HDL7133469.1 phage repressor protein CI [Yersinia enterocolitica]HDL7388958.1 phage repressor protein CI [Yersinia enterocolitica]